MNLSSLIDRRSTCYCLSFSNSAVNPVIYNAVSSKYRRAFRRVFCPCVSRSERHQFVSSVGGGDSSRRLNDEASNVPDCTEGTYMWRHGQRKDVTSWTRASTVYPTEHESQLVLGDKDSWTRNGARFPTSQQHLEWRSTLNFTLYWTIYYLSSP